MPQSSRMNNEEPDVAHYYRRVVVQQQQCLLAWLASCAQWAKIIYSKRSPNFTHQLTKSNLQESTIIDMSLQDLPNSRLLWSVNRTKRLESFFCLVWFQFHKWWDILHDFCPLCKVESCTTYLYFFPCLPFAVPFDQLKYIFWGPPPNLFETSLLFYLYYILTFL